MKGILDIIDRKKRIIDQLHKFVGIFQKLKALEKNVAANKDWIYEVIMEYDGVMKDPENVYNFNKNSSKHEKGREDLYRSYKEGTAHVNFSFFVKDQIERCRLAIKELNFVLDTVSYVE